MAAPTSPPPRRHGARGRQRRDAPQTRDRATPRARRSRYLKCGHGLALPVYLDGVRDVCDSHPVSKRFFIGDRSTASQERECSRRMLGGRPHVHRDVSSRVAAAVTLSCLPVVPAQAQDALSPSRWLDALEDARLVLPLAGLATFLFVVALAAVVSRRRAARARLRAEERCDLLQAQLDEAESLLTAEPHLLYIWRGDQAQPERISGRLPDVQGVPATPEILANFS